MPRQNTVRLVGLVANYPSIKTDKDGTVIQMALPLLVVHGTRDYGEKSKTAYNAAAMKIGEYSFDNVWVMAENDEFLKSFKNCKPYDIVEVKGVLRINNMRKKAFCPSCGERHSYLSSRATVYPIYFSRRVSFTQRNNIENFDPNSIEPSVEAKMKKDGLEYLKRCAEISNEVSVIGVICREPEMYVRDKDGMQMLTFPLAIKRKFYISEDALEDSVDFPYCKIYGDLAEQQNGVLHKANLILIEGFLQTRTVKRKPECKKCGEHLDIPDQVCEIVPYSIEYIRSNISETEFIKNNEGAVPQKVGYETDINIAQVLAEESAEGNGEDKISDDIKKILGTL